MCRVLLFGLILCLLGSVLSDEVAAQPPRTPRYQPAYGPTLSPYLQFARPRVGVLDNYFNFVRPRMYVDQTLSQQQRQITSLQVQTQKNAAGVSGVRDSLAAPTGVGSTYLNYSHYYPAATGR